MLTSPFVLALSRPFLKLALSFSRSLSVLSLKLKRKASSYRLLAKGHFTVLAVKFRAETGFRVPLLDQLAGSRVVLDGRPKPLGGMRFSAVVAEPQGVPDPAIALEELFLA